MVLEQKIFEKSDYNIHQNSFYIKKVRLLAQALQNKNEELISDILNEVLSIEGLLTLDQNDLMNGELRNKIENQIKEDWDARKVENVQKPMNIRESEVVVQDSNTKQTQGIDTALNTKET